MAPRISPIHLIGPGGAGKSTIGAALARRLGCPFCDLDREFEGREGDIDVFIEKHGYAAYAQANFLSYLELTPPRTLSVRALSSGFMVYPESVHPTYQATVDVIASSPTTVVLLPSLDLEICVTETVRRQLLRPFSRRSPDSEEAVIRRRFARYMALPAIKFETMRPAEEAAAALQELLSAAVPGLLSQTARHGPLLSAI